MHHHPVQGKLLDFESERRGLRKGRKASEVPYPVNTILGKLKVMRERSPGVTSALVFLQTYGKGQLWRLEFLLSFGFFRASSGFRCFGNGGGLENAKVVGKKMYS